LLEKPAQRNFVPLKQKNGHLFLVLKSAYFSPKPARNFISTLVLYCQQSKRCMILIRNERSR
ncbi:MAG TPA: hypothetical protein VGN34_28795, partial [Ktedonobacteraceae bacterium]